IRTLGRLRTRDMHLPLHVLVVSLRMSRPHRLLLLLFAITLVSQGTFTLDVIRTLAGDYALKPVTLGAPWPTIVDCSAAAARAGLQRGDRVLAIDGRAPKGESELAQAVHSAHAGGTVKITVDRHGAPVEIATPLE